MSPTLQLDSLPAEPQGKPLGLGRTTKKQKQIKMRGYQGFTDSIKPPSQSVTNLKVLKELVQFSRSVVSDSF